MIEILQLLHEMEEGNSRHSTSYYVRHLYPNEPVPQFDGSHGVLDLPLTQKEWIWVAYSSYSSDPLALLAAAPMQGVVMLLRAYATDNAPNSVFVGLLRKSLADSLSRGYTRYGVFLDTKARYYAKFARLVKKAGGTQIEGEFHLFHGNTDHK